MYKPALSCLTICLAAACGEIYPSDTGRVAVSITAPAPAEQVRDLVLVTASAVATHGDVASVRFELPDGLTTTDVSPPFSTTWDSHTVPDGPYVLRAIATDFDGTSSIAELPVSVANAACLDEVASATGLPRGIPDDDVAGLATSVRATGPGRVAAVSLSLSFRHTLPSELHFELRSPAGTLVPFWFDDDDGASSGQISIANHALSSFNGEPAAGLWHLLVVDPVRWDVGRLDAWSLAIARDCRPIAP